MGNDLPLASLAGSEPRAIGQTVPGGARAFSPSLSPGGAHAPHSPAVVLTDHAGAGAAG